MKPERDGARPGLENFQQKIIVAHVDLHAEHTIMNFQKQVYEIEESVNLAG